MLKIKEKKKYSNLMKSQKCLTALFSTIIPATLHEFGIGDLNFEINSINSAYKNDFTYVFIINFVDSEKMRNKKIQCGYLVSYTKSHNLQKKKKIILHTFIKSKFTKINIKKNLKKKLQIILIYNE